MIRFQWHEDPDKAVIKRLEYLEHVRNTEGEAVYWELLRHSIAYDPWFASRVVFDYGWLDEWVVGNQVIGHIAQNWGEDQLILIPRGHGKTLPMGVVITCAIIQDVNQAVLMLHKDEAIAVKFGKTLSQQWLRNDMLQKCFGTKWNEGQWAVFPSTRGETELWGDDGYALPLRKPRNDPTLECLGLRTSKTGKHPDWAYLDDTTDHTNNNARGYEEIEAEWQNLLLLLPSNGFVVWTGTRWGDGDPTGKAESGKLPTKTGRPFKTLKLSCYVDDNPQRDPIYPRKKRWGMETESGYTKEQLESLRRPQDQGGLGRFFDAQMRNDPSPEERAELQLYWCVPWTEQSKPKNLSHVRSLGIEITGGGLPIFNGFREHCEKLKIDVPLDEIVNARDKGVSKRDKIVAALQPIMESGRLHISREMFGDNGTKVGTLGYEIKRLRAAANDDIVDVLKNIIVHQIRGLSPMAHEPAHLYIGVDLAWTEEQRADWSVVMAVAVDAAQNYFVLDYDRFQSTSPNGIYQRILEFYQRFAAQEAPVQQSRRRYPGAWR